MMKILFLSYSQPASFELFCRDSRTNCPWVDSLIEELIKYEDIDIALSVPVNSLKFERYKSKNLTLYGLPNPRRDNIFNKLYNRFVQPAESTSINSYVQEVISDFKPDLIQIFGSENPFGLISYECNVPVIIHIQGYLQVWARKWYSGISKSEQYHYSDIKDLLLRRGSYFEYFSFVKRARREALILQKCRYFTGRTDFDKRLAQLFSPGSQYFHCEESIRNVFFEKQWQAQKTGTLNCLSILKGTTYKGLDLLIEVLLILKERLDYTVKFKICGVSKDEEIVRMLWKKFGQKIQGLDIEFLGRLSANEIVEQLTRTNFYLHPSYIENSPNSICEAMALGVPIISTNVGGISSLITDNVEGILVQEGEPYSMAAAIINLTNDYESAKLLGENARKKAFERHNPRKIATRLLEIYRTILEV